MISHAHDKNKPDWVLDAESRTKSITFDYEAQRNLPQHIKDKMKADREKAQQLKNL